MNSRKIPLLVIGIGVGLYAIGQMKTNEFYGWCRGYMDTPTYWTCIMSDDSTRNTGELLVNLGVVTFILGVSLVVAVSLRRSKYRECSACREMVRRDANVCRFCQTPLAEV